MPNIVAIRSGARFCRGGGGVKIRHLPLTWPVTLNTYIHTYIHTYIQLKFDSAALTK